MLRCWLLPVLTTSACLLFAQSKPAFEVASIKPAAPDQRGIAIRPGANGGLNINNMPLKELITFAWRIQPYQIIGAPAWIESARYDITTVPDHKPKGNEIWLMLQSLLEDRFQLKTHNETKELPIYALVLANKDGKLGPQLTEAKEGSCTAIDPTKPPPPPSDPGKPPVLGCGGMFMGPDRMEGASNEIKGLIPVLSRTLGRTVVDKTGLTGKYDMHLYWTPDPSQMMQGPFGGGPPPPGGPAPPPVDPNGPSIFTALQEQLGLKLESQKGPVDVLVIDHVEKPSEN
jgi:uncharacterized protein (TIGR03435 family)